MPKDTSDRSGVPTPTVKPSIPANIRREVTYPLTDELCDHLLSLRVTDKQLTKLRQAMLKAAKAAADEVMKPKK